MLIRIFRMLIFSHKMGQMSKFTLIWNDRSQTLFLSFLDHSDFKCGQGPNI
jgi:hypothetical protein